MNPPSLRSLRVATKALRFAATVLAGVGLVGPGSAVAADPPGYACATAHPLATDACLEILAEGGNAFDAAVAASAALAVVEPTGSGLGGGGFWLLHRAQDGLEVFVDGRETAPAAATPGMYLDENGQPQPQRSRYGSTAAAIPGEPAALDHIARRYGSRKLSRLLAPAIRHARDGFAVDGKLARAIVEQEPNLSWGARRLLVPDGQALREGDLLRQPDLAWTLEALARSGRAGFYEGEVAEKLLTAVQRTGGLWTAEDLRRYQVVEREPLQSWYRGYRIVSAPPPSAGGVALAQLFQQLEVLGWQDDPGIGSRHRLVEAIRRAYRDRAEFLGDPDRVRVPTYALVTRDRARQLAASIEPARATPSASLPPAPLSPEGSDTTHLSVIDARGNRVAATLSINLPFGSGFLAPGTGVFLNDEMDDFSTAVGVANAYGLVGSRPNAIAPLKRPLSSMSPTFVEGPRGLLVLGTPGGSRIVTMVALGILRWIGGGDAQAVVAAPRIHHQYLPDLLQFEPGALSEEQQQGLQALGHVLAPQDRPWGNLQAITWDGAAKLEAASDPRGVGAARVVAVPQPSTVRKAN
ncbi:MAG TPA: gamma-glutamyltransferase [Solimonas sp.]|nr:gamma-glutamyltransferase [Solimonas sp.]